MHRVLVNVASSNWSVHFIGPDGKTRIGPWLLLDSREEVLEILRWGDVAAEALAEHESALRRWGCSSVVVMLTDAKLAALIERGRGWPWNGYELRQMKAAGKYPPQRITGKAMQRAGQDWTVLACKPCADATTDALTNKG